MKIVYLSKSIIALIIVVHTLHLQAQNEEPIAQVEAEDGVLVGVTKGTSTQGYTGTGYVTGFDNSGDKLTVNVSVPSRTLYKLVIRYNSSSGEKTQKVIINDGFATPVIFPKTTGFVDLEAGSHLFEAGVNTITIEKDWGYTDIDQISLYNYIPHVYNITNSLVDANADDATVALYNYLKGNFGQTMISGQTDSYYDELVSSTGIKPMMRVSDMQHYTVGYSYLWKDGGFSFGWDDNGNSEAMINWYNATNKKGIVGFQWHWHSPSDGQVGKNTFYTDQTSFDIRLAVQEGTPQHTAILRDIDSVATQLKKFQAAGIPVLWRPLHEAGGGWFWWGAKGAEPCKALYDIIYDRISNYHQIHNLIWVWSTHQSDWYPGNDKVDIIGHDSYPGEYNYGIQKTMFDKLYDLVDGKKIIAMSENGPIPNPEDCLTLDAPWSFFMSWSDLVDKQNSTNHLADVFTNPKVTTLGYVDSPVLLVPKTTLFLSGELNGVQPLPIYSNTNWKITSDQDWLLLGETSGSGDAVVTVTAASNTLSNRSATLTVSSAGLPSKKVTVTQKINPDFVTAAQGEFKLDQLTVYPNPCEGRLFIKDHLLKGQNVSIQIINSQGIVLHRQMVTLANNGSAYEVDLSGISTGIYFMYVQSDNYRKVQKIIVK